ncbi:MAG: branched-chain amino acid ABC transporter permease, partial [Alphaproteobacteria bacterium]
MIATQLLVNAAALGAAYALVAVGFVLVLNATTAVNFAHGETVVAGGFAAVAMASLLPLDIAVPGLILLPGVLAVSALLGLAIGALAYLPIRNRPPVSVFVTTIAVGIIIANSLNA